MPFYLNSTLNKYLKQQDSDVVAKTYLKFTKDFHNPTIQHHHIRERKEEQLTVYYIKTPIFNHNNR